jgi:hypothetical protein
MEFKLLGPLEASDGSTPIALAGRKQRALLARLLLDANRTVATDRLVDDLWGEDVPESAQKIGADLRLAAPQESCRRTCCAPARRGTQSKSTGGHRPRPLQRFGAR